MDLLNQHQELRQQIFEYFGYVENWRVLPLDDERESFWDVVDDDTVCFADTEEELKDQEGNYYECEIYTQRHLGKWVYEGAEYTMILIDTHTDRNQFLSIFDNSKRRMITSLREEALEESDKGE